MIKIKPKRIRILLNNVCNAKCFYCHNEGQKPALTKNKINPEFVGRLLDNVFTSEVVISGGEPTLHPRIVEISKEIKKRGIKLTLNTNGSMGQRLESLYDIVDGIKFSIDAVNKSAYEKIKKIPYEVVLQNLLAAKKKNIDIKINAPFTSMKNAVDLIKFSEDNKIGVKFIEVLKSDFSEPPLKIDNLKKVLQKRGYKIQKFGQRNIARKRNGNIILMQCYCRGAVQTDNAASAIKICRNYTDLFITPQAEIKPCIYEKYSISIYEPIMRNNPKLINEKFKEFDNRFGKGI